MRELRPDDPMAEFEAMRGELRRNVVPVGGRAARPLRRPDLRKVRVLVAREEAAAFSRDDALRDIGGLIAELAWHLLGKELCERFAFASKYGRKRLEGHWILLYLASVLAAEADWQEFYAKWKLIIPLCGF